ncbi:MAG: cytochrome D1 [Gammaproteobacteria bacterium]|nr:cytochrome D1 [Gammaproteobacteria bacterium]
MLHFLRITGTATAPLLALLAVGATLATVPAVAEDELVGPLLEMPVNTGLIQRKGMNVEFTARPLRPGAKPRDVMEGEFADIEFRITGAEDGEPLQSVYPGVWIDLTQTPDGEKKGTSLECRQRVTQYLQGLVGMRPMIDLNSYYIMVLNRDASISIIDPVVGITGITSLYANIPLKRPGADWAKTADEKTMFVSMPRAGEIAVVDLDTFKVTKNVAAGEMPMRTVLQPDERYLWIGNDAESGKKGGVTVIETATGNIVATIETGAGHHEIGFSGDSRSAFVSNRESGTVTVIDIGRLETVDVLNTGPVPISIAYSPLSEAAYIADGQSGIVTVIDAERREVVSRIEAKPGLGPMKFSEDGRWGILVNPLENETYVIDAATDEIAHTIAIDGKPFSIGITRTFAYLRVLESERISMINLQELDRGGQVIVNNFAAGSFPPGQVADISIAEGMVPAAQEAAVLVVSPADATVYYYMEGMNAPMGAFRNYGHKPRAVQIANRALKETSPGVYSATVKVPTAGTFEVAFLNEAPQFLHCFEMQAKVNPAIEHASRPLAVEYLSENKSARVGENMLLRFRLYDPGTSEIKTGATDVRVKFFRAPRYNLTELLATQVGEGIYEAELPFKQAGAYYVYVAAPSLGADYQDLDYRTIMVGKALTSQTTVGATQP